MTILSTGALLSAPAAVAGVAPTLPASPTWGSGAWVEIIASTSADIAITGILSIMPSSAAIQYEVELGIGGAGSEVPIGAWPWYQSAASAGGPGQLDFHIPVAVASGSRVAVRIRANTSGTGHVASIAIQYVEDPDAATTAETYGCTPAAANMVSLTPNGTAWNNSSWVEMTAGLSDPTAIAGFAISFGVDTGTDYEVDIGVGGAGSEAVITTISSIVPSIGSGISFRYHELLAALYPVTGGPRVAVRLRKAGTSTAAWLFKMLALDGFAIPIQKMTQIVALFGTDRYAAAPPTITPCVGGGTISAGANPSDGTSLATATAIFPWIEFTIGATTYAWGQAADNKGTYPIRPKVEKFGPIKRRMSDPRGGYQGSSQDIWLLDDDGTIGGIYASQSWVRKTVHTYIQEESGIGTGTKQRRFRGYIRGLKHEGGIRYRMTVEDVLSFYFSKNGQERKIPQTLITVVDGNADPGVRLKCAPVLMGSLSSAADAVPDGTVEFEFVKTETLDPPNDVLGNLHTHLIGIRPIGDTQAVFMGDPASNPPTVRSQVAAGEYGTRVYAPGQSGYPTAAVYQVRDGKRWAFLYVDQNHPGADAARYGRIPITGDVCGREGVGDGTGDTFDLLPYQYMHILDVEVFQAVGDDDNPSLLTLDGYTILNHASFVAVDGIQDTRLTGGAPGAFSLGHGGRQITLRQFIKQANVSGDWDTTIDHHGRVMIDMLDRSDAYSSAPVFTEGLNILDGTFRVEDDGSDRVANKVTAKYKRRYKRSLQQPTTLLEGSRGPREPFDPDFDGLYDNEDTTAQQDLGTASNPEVRELELELELVRDDDWAEDVVDNQLDMWKSASGRPTVSFAVFYRDGLVVPMGGVIKVTHSEAPASGGWTLRRLRVVGIDDTPGEAITFYAMDVEDLLP